MGLYEIIERMDGEIAFETDENGTTFIIILRKDDEENENN